MIIILTGGTQKTRKCLMQQLAKHIEYTHIEGDTYAEQRSKLLQNLPSAKNLLLTCCFLKSQRYEIYCISKRYNMAYCVVLDGCATDFDAYEVPNPRFVYDKPMYTIDTLQSISKLQAVKHNNKAHTKKAHVSSDYFLQVQQIVQETNKERMHKSYILKECEQKLYNILQINNLCIDKVRECYKQIIQNEIESKKI